MFQSLKTFFLAFTCIAMGVSSLSAQISLSPYSRYGLGDPFNPSSTRNFSMGSIGIGAFDGTSINRINPASYADLRLTTFDFSGFGQYSIQKSNINKGSVGTAGFHNVSIGFSNRKGFGIVAGLAPYSSTGYNVILQDSILTDTGYSDYTTTYNANGGLNQFYIGAGVRFFRHLNLGVNLTYAFGSTNYTSTTDFSDNRLQTVSIDQRVTLGGLVPQFGAQYGDTIRIRREVERIKTIEDELKALETELEGLDRAESDLKKGNEKLTTWVGKQDAKVKAIDEEKASIEKQVEDLMKDEVENEKAMRKLQERQFRLEKQRKRLVRDTKARNREATEAENRIQGRRTKIKDRQAALNREMEEIKAGRKEATEIKRQAYLIRAGAIFEPASVLQGDRMVTLNTIISDTLSTSDGSARLPMKYGIGFSIVRPTRWSIGVDASVQDWSRFEYFDEAPSLLAAYNINAGGEWIPDLISQKYGERIAYRAGFYYNGAFLKVDDTPITEYGVTLGVGLPIGFLSAAAQNFSRINVGVGVGRRGTLEGNLLEETTFHFRLGVNLNDIWFIKRRID